MYDFELWINYLNMLKQLKKNMLDFPGDTVATNPPASAGDMGSIPGPGRFHMLWSS